MRIYNIPLKAFLICILLIISSCLAAQTNSQLVKIQRDLEANPENAYKMIDSLLKKYPRNSRLIFYKGYYLDITKNLSLAKYYYSRSIFLDSTMYESYYNLGVIWYNEGLKYFEETEYPTSLEQYKEKLVSSSFCFYSSKFLLDKARQLNKADSSLLKIIHDINVRLNASEVIFKKFGL